MLKFPSKMPKIPGTCREYFLAYYAESNAGIIGLTLWRGPAIDIGALFQRCHTPPRSIRQTHNAVTLPRDASPQNQQSTHPEGGLRVRATILENKHPTVEKSARVHILRIHNQVPRSVRDECLILNTPLPLCRKNALLSRRAEGGGEGAARVARREEPGWTARPSLGGSKTVVGLWASVPSADGDGRMLRAAARQVCDSDL